MTLSSNTAALSVEGCWNLRDAGGWPVGEGEQMMVGRLFRADDPRLLTEQGRRQVDALDLAVAIDLRQHGRTDVGRGFVPSDRRCHLPLVDRVINTDDPQPITAAHDLADLYEEMLTVGADQLVQVIELIADHVAAGEAVLVHCAYGKDRTGLVIALIQAAIGCSPEVIVAEYAASDAPAQARTAALMARPIAGDTDLATVPPLLLRAPSAAMVELIDRMQTRHGSLLGWVEALPVGAETVVKLRAGLVEPIR